VSSLEARLTGLEDRPDRRVQGLVDTINTRFLAVEGRPTAIETRLDGKAGDWTVSLWGATVMGWTAILVGAAVTIVKLWP
jgi:hypothetical protein